MGIAGRFKDGDLLLAGEVDERLPTVSSGLISYFPMDGSYQDMMTEKYIPGFTMTARDRYADFFPSHFDYKGAQFIVTGKVMCHDLIDVNVTTGTGFYLTNTNDDPAWYRAKTLKLGDIRDKWVPFVASFTVPSNYKSGLRMWTQIDHAATTTGVLVEYKDVTYTMISNPNIIANNVISTDFHSSIQEGTTNYIKNGDFKNGLEYWTNTADATTQNLIQTPYGTGVRITRGDGNGGEWSLRQVSSGITYNAKETWVWSFKYRTLKGPNSRPFYVGWWITDNGGTKHDLPVIEFDLEDGWKQAYAPYTFVGGPYSGSYAAAFNTFYDNTVVDFADIKLEKRNFPTESFHGGTRGDGSLQVSYNSLPSSYTLISEKKHVTESSFTRYALTKDTSNNFTFYKDGVETTEFKNKFSVTFVGHAGYGIYAGIDPFRYSNPTEKLSRELPMVSNIQPGNKGGQVLRTFLYCTSPVTVVHKYSADNYGSTRLNNGTFMDIGTTSTANPEITFNLIQGWNLVEYFYGDSAGTTMNLQLVSGYTDFTAVPEIVYITAELPIEMIGNNINFNEKSNVSVRNMGIYNRVLSTNELKLLYDSKLSIKENGNLHMVVQERAPYIPSDSTYFPLDFDAKDINDIISPNRQDNLVFEDGSVWVGMATTNLVKNGDGKTNPAPYTEAWDVNKHSSALSVDSWYTGYNSGVPSSTIGYHAQWVYEGVDGSLDPCIKFVDRNTDIGYPQRWLGVSQGLGSPTSLGWSVGTSVTTSWLQRVSDIGKCIQSGIYHTSIATGSMTFGNTGVDKYVSQVDTWERVYHTFTVSSDMKLDGGSTIYLYGNKGKAETYGWVDNVMIENRPFPTPFTPGTRGDTMLQYNFNRDLGLDWSADWSIVYFKTPVGTANNTMTYYNIESIGCNGNTVGSSYLWWGKGSAIDAYSWGKANLTTENPVNISFSTSNYFNKNQMVSIIKSGSTITIRYHLFDGTVVSQSINVTSSLSSNAFVTQHGYDFMMGGWDNTRPGNTYYRDLIVAKRALTDDELTKYFRSRYSTKNGIISLQGKISEGVTLT